MKKLGLVVFSSNRPQYLQPVLDSLSLLDVSRFSVYRLLIDDFPRNRDPRFFLRLGFDRVILNESIKGYDRNILTAWQLLLAEGVDYIWHQEDDYKITSRIDGGNKITSRIDVEKLAAMCTGDIVSVCLKRAPWYPFEIERECKWGAEWIIKNDDGSDRPHELRKELHLSPLDRAPWFYFMPTIYTTEVASLPFAKYGLLPLEGTIPHVLTQEHGRRFQVLYGRLGEYHCEHIGERSHGIKASPGMPGFGYANSWAGGAFDPLADFDSRTGRKL